MQCLFITGFCCHLESTGVDLAWALPAVRHHLSLRFSFTALAALSCSDLPAAFRIAFLLVSVGCLRNTHLLEVYLKEVQVQGCAQMCVRSVSSRFRVSVKWNVWTLFVFSANIRELGGWKFIFCFKTWAMCPPRIMYLHFKPESSLYE